MALNARNRRISDQPKAIVRRPRSSQRRPVAERHSLATILDLVRSGAATRQDLERRSGLGRAVVADRLATLIESGLVREGELGQPSGGRAPRLVEFHTTAGVVMVAMIDRSTIGVAMSDLAGRLLMEHHEAMDVADGPEACLKRLQALFEWMLEQDQRDRSVWGIGLAVPAPVEPARHWALPTPPAFHLMPTWDRFPFVESLVAKFDAPVVVRSNVQMMTLGESRAGSGIGVNDLLFVKIGRSISAGLIAGGQFHLGAQGAAGLIGHMAADVGSGVVCRCGNTGCLEVVAGEDAIIRESIAAASDGRSRQLAEAQAANGEITVTDVANAAQLGDAFSTELLARCGRMIGATLADLANALNPSLIVLSGGVVQSDDIFLAAIREAVYRRSHPLITRDLRIVRSQMGNSSGLMGAAIAVVEELFEPSFLTDWVGEGSPLDAQEVAVAIAAARDRVVNRLDRPKPPAP